MRFRCPIDLLLATYQNVDADSDIGLNYENKCIFIWIWGPGVMIGIETEYYAESIKKYNPMQ